MRMKRLLKYIGVAMASLTIFIVGVFNLSDGTIDAVFNYVKDFTQEDIQLEEHEAKIVRVVDGDTVIVETKEEIEERVRLLLIDTPESVHPQKEKELFGEEASDYAKEMLQEGDVVTLEIGNPERDRYDRLLAYIWVDDVNFNEHMIEKGYARVGYVYEPNTKYIDEFRKAEQKAKKEKINIWSIEGYVKEDGFDMSVVQ